MANAEALSAGIGSVPTPLTNISDENWLWHSFFDCRVGMTDAADGAGFMRIVIDSKAMRKWDTGHGLYAAFEVVEVGTAQMDLFLNTRELGLLA